MLRQAPATKASINSVDKSTTSHRRGNRAATHDQNSQDIAGTNNHISGNDIDQSQDIVEEGMQIDSVSDSYDDNQDTTADDSAMFELLKAEFAAQRV